MAADNIVIIFATGMFCVLFLASVGLIQLVQQKTKKRDIIDKIKISGKHALPHQTNPEQVLRHDVSGLFAWPLLKKLGARFVPQKSDQLTHLRKRFRRAGIQADAAPAVFWSFKIILPVTAVICFVLIRLSVLKVFAPQATILVGVTWALVGFYLPDLWLHQRTAKRTDAIFRSLPDALDLLVVSVEAGMGLDAAFQRVAEEFALSNKALSDEFKWLNLELRSGLSRNEALRNMADRIALDDVQSLTTLLIQTEQFGTSIAEALRVFADTFRTKRFQRAEEIAAKIPVKLIFPLGLFIFPSMFVVTIGPGVIKIYQNLLAG